MIQTIQNSFSDDLINLAFGRPSASLLPVEIMRQAAEHRLTQGDSSLLQYGAEQGDGYFRLALADFLSKGYRVPVQAENLLVTAGISQALDFVCTMFTLPNDTVFVEEPTYFLALRIFADHKLNVVGLPTDENGLIIDALEEKLTQQQPVFVYTIPSYHNPTGRTLSHERSQQLVKLSQKHNFIVLADEVYQLLTYTITPPPPMASYIESGTVLSLGTFSKILAPGLRLGWIQAAPALLKPLIGSGMVDSGGSLNHFTSGIVRSVIELGLLDQHLARLKTTYHQRLVTLNVALRQHLPDWVTFTEPSGGFFFWLELPEEFDTSKLLAEALAHHGVSFQPGIKFSSQQSLRNCMRLTFSLHETDELKEGVKRLKQVIAPS